MSTEMKTYGAKLNAIEIQDFLDYVINQNTKISKEGDGVQRGTPVCIWGPHGIGKTQSVINFAKRNDYTYVYCAPAQFEEVGDLHGIPETYDPTPEMPNSGDEYTVYRPPQWLHSALSNVHPDKPGILILDDFNRAEPRIIQSCMQLLQMHALFSWELPLNWQIVLTANPEGGAYNVNEMDDAMLTRMLHITMEFDVECWAKWAINAGLDNRGIEFLLTYPQVVTGIRTTARSFTQFLRQISGIKDLDNPHNLRMIEILGKGTLEDDTINKFLHFCKFVKRKLLSPKEILETRNFDRDVSDRIKQVVSGDGYKRTDLLNTMCTNLCLYLSSDKYTFVESHKENFINFCLHPDMVGSMQFKVHHLLSQSEKTKPLLRDSRLAEVVLKAM